MTVSLVDFDSVIHDEMLIHPLFFTHPHVKNAAILSEKPVDSVAIEALKHTSLTALSLVSPESLLTDPRLTLVQKSPNDWLEQAFCNSFDALIVPNNLEQLSVSALKKYLIVLTKGGILIHQGPSLFDLKSLKISCQYLQEAGFYDLHILNFPQPGFSSGWRSALMAIKDCSFRRVREKDVFNKLFSTHYYNFDVHKASLVMPEFMREEIVL